MAECAQLAQFDEELCPEGAQRGGEVCHADFPFTPISAPTASFLGALAVKLVWFSLNTW